MCGFDYVVFCYVFDFDDVVVGNCFGCYDYNFFNGFYIYYFDVLNFEVLLGGGV